MDETEHTRFTTVGTFAPVTLVLTMLDPAPDFLEQLSCVEQQRMWPSELLIVDRGCGATGRAWLHQWLRPPGITVRVIDAPGASIAHARNLAIESAHYDHITVTDLRAYLHPDWLAKVWGALDSGADAVTGMIEPVDRTVWQRAIGVVRAPLPDEIDQRTFLPQVGTIGFSKTVWDDVAGYPEWLESGHDFVFAHTLRQAGVVIAVIPETIGSARSPETLSGYLTDCWHTANAAGRAGVTTRRGITASVLTGCLILAVLSRRRSTGLLLLGGLSAHLRPFLRREWLTRKGSLDRNVNLLHRKGKKDPLVARLTAVSGVVLVGDTTKIAAYLAGLISAVSTHHDIAVRLSGRRRRVDQGEWVASPCGGETRPAGSATGGPRSGSNLVTGEANNDHR